MIFPFDSLTAHARELGLVVAVLLGFGFGFVLERAGFGRAPKLAAQFYLYDMTVFKVMFGAIVTAMLGSVVAAGLGLMDLRAVSDVATSNTWMLPLVVGGFLLGVGFIIAGYCPGTAIVSAASGNVDGILAFVGVIVGTFVYSEADPLVSKFQDVTDLGHVYLYDLLKVPAPVIALGVAAMAVGCFLGAEKVERIFSAKLSDEERPSDLRWAPAAKRIAFGTFAVATVVALATLALPTRGQTAAPRVAAKMGAAELARRVLEEPWTMRVIDVRSADACAAARVPGAECAPVADLEKLGLADAPASRDLVFVADAGVESVPAAASGFAGRVYALDGGFGAWKAFALTPPAVPAAEAGLQAIEDYKLRAAVNAAMTGIKQAPPPAVPAGSGAPRKKKGGGGCSG